jgi:predicted RecA/RadA family phage recombinase
MKIFIGEGKVVNVTAPFAVVSGQWLKIGSMLGVCGADAAVGKKVALWVEGEYSVTKAGSQAWTEGVKVYFDNDLKVFTTANVSGGIAAGVAIEAVGSGSGETTGKIRLSAAF